MNKFARFVPTTRASFAKVGAGLGALALLPAARAELPATVNTALESAKTDGLAMAAAVLAVIVAIYAFKLMRKGL